jgi:hypothetical protein
MGDFDDAAMTARLAALRGQPSQDTMQIQGLDVLDVAVPDRQVRGMEPSWGESVTQPIEPERRNNRSGSRAAPLRPTTTKPPRY